MSSVAALYWILFCDSGQFIFSLLVSGEETITGKGLLSKTTSVAETNYGKSTYILLYNTRSTYILFCNTRSTYILLWAEIMNIITIITSPLSPHPQHHHRRLHNGKMLKYFDTADLAFNCFPFPLYKYSMMLSSGTLMMMILF